MAVFFDYDKKKTHIFADDVYVKNGKIDGNYLVLDYSCSVNPLSIDLSTIGKEYCNALSDMQFYANDNKSILSMALAIEKIVSALGGNRLI